MGNRNLKYAGKPSNGTRNNAGRRTSSLGPGERMVLVEIQGDSDESEMMTVYLGQDGNPQETQDTLTDERANQFAPNMVAHVVWGNDGAQHEATIDYRDGACFSVACSFLRVSVENLEDRENPRAGVAEHANVACSVSYGTRPPWTSATRTVPFEADTQPVRIPPYAQRVHLLFVSAVSDASFLDATGAVIAQVNTDNAWQSAPIPNNARQIEAESNCVFVFDLSF